MKHESRDTKTPASADRERAARDRDEARELSRARARRIGAAQMAAPSTRTWRRAGTFSSYRLRRHR
jgi:muconolactone delta-isomerase